MSSTAAPPQPGAATELSESDVLRWLSSRGLTATHAALTTELAAHDGSAHRARVASPATEPETRGLNVAQHERSGLEGELGEGVCEALAAYADLAGEAAAFALLERWSPDFRTRYLHYAGHPSELARATAERRALALEEANTRLRARDRELDTQLPQTVAIIAERLQTLTGSVDPMHKDILLPLLRIVAVLGAASTIRAAARHMMLTLYKRPTMEHRLAIVQEWLRVAQEAPPRTLEQELIPELYTLVNAQVFERRLLALECAAAAAPLLRRSPQVRYSLCQGLLRPLCEDDTSAVRRELPRCFSLLCGESAAPADAMAAAPHAAPRPHTGVVTSPSHAAHTAPAGGDAPVGLSATQKTLVMELLVHLATDGSSRTVREAAQTQLCEVLYPAFLRDGVLLTQFVPLLLTVIGMEATQLLLVRGGSNRGGGSGPTVSGAVGSEEARKGSADDASASMAAVVSLSNVMTLIQLLHTALRCVAAEVLHCREAEGRGDGGSGGGGQLSAPGAAAASATDGPTTASSLTWTYVHVVLPTAYNMLALLLAKVRFASPVGGSEAAAQHATEPSARLSGPLCALCATLASLVPLLGAAAWHEVLRFLESALALDATAGVPAPSSAGSGSAATPAPPPAAVDASLTPQDGQRGRQLFVFSFLLFLCGDAVALPSNSAGGAAAAERAESGGAPATGPAPTPASTLSSSASFSPAQIQAGSLSIVARCICLSAEDLACPRSPALLACVHGVVALAPFAMESHEMASGISSLVDFLVASPAVRLRLTAVVLVHDTCALLTNERLKVALLLEPLVPLLRDEQPTVQEAALSGILSASIALTEPRAQERAIRPVLRVADVAGCTSRFTRRLLQQCDQLMGRMPAEPREALLYPQLSVLMDRLAEEFVERVSREGAAAVPAEASATSNADGAGGVSGEGGDGAVQAWEETMLVLQALLNSVIKSAVVTPTLVYRFLLPGIQQLASDGVLSSCSATVRSRWVRLHKNYYVFMDNNNTSRLAASGGSGSGGHSDAATPGSGTLLDRFKDELKRRL